MVKLSFEDLLNKASRGEPDPADSPSEQPKAPPRVSQPDSDSEPDSKPAAVPPARTSTRSRRKPVKLDSDSDSDDPVTITNVRPGANKATPVPIMSPPGTLLNKCDLYRAHHDAAQIAASEIKLLADYADMNGSGDIDIRAHIDSARLMASPQWTGYLFVTSDNTIKILHSLGSIITPNPLSMDNGNYIGFINDRIINTDGTLADPPVLRIAPDDIFSWTGALTPAALNACKKRPKLDGRKLIPVDQQAPYSLKDGAPFLCPCHISWARWLLEQTRSVRELVVFLMKRVSAWPKTTEGTTSHNSRTQVADLALQFSATAVTCKAPDKENTDNAADAPSDEEATAPSLILLPHNGIDVLAGDAGVWASAHLNAFLPTPQPPARDTTLMIKECDL